MLFGYLWGFVARRLKIEKNRLFSKIE